MTRTMTPEDWMSRYAVESSPTDAYDDYDVDLFVVCLECRMTALTSTDVFHVGSMMVPELGCLGPWVGTSRLDLKAVTELVLGHEESAHAP